MLVADAEARRARYRTRTASLDRQCRLRATASSAFDRRSCGRWATGAIRRRPAFFAAAAPRSPASPRSRPPSSCSPVPACCRCRRWTCSTFCTTTSRCRSGATPGRSLLPTASRGGAWPGSRSSSGSRRSSPGGPRCAGFTRASVASWSFTSWRTRAVRHGYVARLTAWVDWLAARTLGAELLKDVVRLEQTDALTAIVGGGSALDERAAWRLVRLTDLLARLTSHAGAPARERWRSLAIWHQALMWIDHRAGTGPRAARSRRSSPRLPQPADCLLDRLDDVDDVEGDALSSGLRRDLQWLVEYASASRCALRRTGGGRAILHALRSRAARRAVGARRAREQRRERVDLDGQAPPTA